MQHAMQLHAIACNAKCNAQLWPRRESTQIEIRPRRFAVFFFARKKYLENEMNELSGKIKILTIILLFQ